MALVSLADFEARAREVLPAPVWTITRGELTTRSRFRENRAAFDRIRLHYRVLRGTYQRDMSLTVLGHPLRMPILVAPVALLGMARPDGDAAAARAAAAGSIFVLSTLSMTPVEDVARAADGPVWFSCMSTKTGPRPRPW